jgi:hypothetical protein
MKAYALSGSVVNSHLDHAFQIFGLLRTGKLGRIP